MAKEKSTNFLAYHHPALSSGNYTIEQQLHVNSGYAKTNKAYRTGVQHFYVGGERFSIPPHLVFAAFPPKASEGLYKGCLPHVELTRSTLPWERKAEKLDAENKVQVPWLTLLIVSEEEVENGLVQPASMSGSDYKKRFGLQDEPGENQTDSQQLPVLGFKKSFLQQIMPSAEDISLLTHVRVIENEIATSHIPSERTFVVSGRILDSGQKYSAHLVSLEGRFSGGLFDFAETDGLVPLLSLYSWEFASIREDHYKLDTFALSKLEAHAKASDFHSAASKIAEKKNELKKQEDARLFRNRENFTAYLQEEGWIPVFPDAEKIMELCRYEAATLRSLLNNLDVSQFQLTLSAKPANAAVEKYLETGSVPLPHQLRAGGNTVSWYRGPFVAWNTEFPADENQIAQTHSDQLIQHNLDTGLLDVSHAAAWELGRLLLINEPKLIQQLQMWKLRYRQSRLLKEQRREAVHLTSFMKIPRPDDFPESVRNFILQCLKLNFFPYYYLVPHKSLLPGESARIFKVDSTWLHSFVCGALSIGEEIESGEIRKIIENIISLESPILKLDNIFGLLICSEAVSGWPGLQIEAYAGEAKVQLWHRNQLSDKVVLCLFKGKFDRIELFLPQGASHFGFDWDKDRKQYQKDKQEVQLTGKDTVNIKVLAEKHKAVSSGELAVTLLHRQERVVFEIQ